MNRRKLTYYLLLNVFVSACVTSAILYWYDRNYRAVTLPQPPATAPAAVPVGTTSAASVPEGAVQIVSVIGAGNLQAEAVVVKYAGAGELDLTGWHLKDSVGHTYTFPPFKLFQDGAVQVHTAVGNNTAIDLFWGQRQAVWQSGQAVLLTTPNGDVQDSYPVP
ncbi:MAG TPA: lamin tail domain-containing protein [Anaerolineales bacterium]